MPESHSTANLSLSFAKLVATPTDIAWSQAYNAGNLFACLSLALSEPREEISLHALGKETFNVLQSEFFTLQDKNITSIKDAIRISLESLPEQITVCLTLTYFKDTKLFVFIAGSGNVVMKRGDKIGTLLQKFSKYDGTITTASGLVQNSDTIILETGQFAEGNPQESVNQALELVLPNDIAEALSPQMHKQDNGAQAAIVIAYHGISPKTPIEEETSDSDEERTVSSLYKEPTTPQSEPEEPLVEEKKRQTKPQSLPENFNFQLDHRRKLFLNIALILVFILILSIYFTDKKYTNGKQQALFQSIYPPAEQYYSEGKGLASVNASLSQEDFHKAQSLLSTGESKFNNGSSEYQQIASLLAQVDSAVQSNTAGQSTNATAVQPQQNSLLAVEQSMSNGIAFGQDTTDVYAISNTAITRVSKTTGNSQEIIKNDNYWSQPVAVVPYEDNIYVLDQEKGLLKFVPSSGGFGKTNYFAGNAPDLSQATSMAIDGTIWILFKDGTIMQYSKGVSTGLKLSGLLKPLNNPTKIVTDITMESVYVLDNGNGQIAQFDKTGKYQNAYSSSVIANAKDMDVTEQDKKIFILSQGKVWQINL